MNFWSSDVQKRLCSYLLNKTVGPFLKSNLDLMSVQLFNRNGKFYLPELQLNVEKINELLKDLPFFLIEAKVGEINAVIPWWDLKNSNVSIQLKDIYLKLLIEEEQLGIFNNNDELFYDVAETFMNSSSINIANEFLNQELQADITNDNNESEGSESKVQFFSSIIDKIIAKLEIILLNIKISVIFNIDKNKDTQLNNNISIDNNNSNSNNNNNDNNNGDIAVDEFYQKCGFDICIPHIKLVEGSIINENKDKVITNIMKDIIFNEFSIHLNYYKDQNEESNINSNNNININQTVTENELFYSTLNKQDNLNSINMSESNLEESIFYDAKDEEQFKNMNSIYSSSMSSEQSDDNYYENPLAMTQSHIYQTTYEYDYSSTKIDPNISQSYRIFSCSRNAKNIIHITRKSSKSLTPNKGRNSINFNTGFIDISINENSKDNNNDDRNNAFIEVKLNEWIFDLELENICILLLPKNLETILLLINKLIPSLSPNFENNLNKKSKGSHQASMNMDNNMGIQENFIPGSFPSSDQINKINRRTSSQSNQFKSSNKKPKQRNNIFTLKCNLKNLIIFIINDEKEKICLPYFDYPSFMDELFDSSVSEDLTQFNGFNDDFLKIKSPAEMINEYHLKLKIDGLSFQINMISNKYYNISNSNNNINSNSKDTRKTNMTIHFLMKSITLSEWINGSYNDILYTQKKYPNYDYYKKIVDINLLNCNTKLIKPYSLEGSILSNKLEMDISNLFFNISYSLYKRLFEFSMNIYNKMSIIMKEKKLFKTVSDSSSKDSINELYNDLIKDNIIEDNKEEAQTKDKFKVIIKFNDIKFKLLLDEIDKNSRYNGIMIDLINSQFEMVTDIQFQICKTGITLLSIEPEEIQREPLLFITSSNENWFLSIIINQKISENDDPNAFLKEFLDNRSPNDYGKFWFKERSIKQSKYQINANINELYININPEIIKGIMHIINFVLDTFVNISSNNQIDINNNYNLLSKNEITSSYSYNSLISIQEISQKKFELITINVKMNKLILLLFGLNDIYYRLTLETFDSFVAFSNLGPYCIYITSELFSFDERSLNSSVSFPIIQNNPYQNLIHMIEVSIYSLAKENLNILNFNVTLSEVLFNIDIPCLIQLGSISNLLTDLPPIHTTNDEPLALRFSITFNNLLLGYEILELSPQLIIKFNEINIYNENIFIVGEILSLNLNISMSKINILLTDHDIPPEINSNQDILLVDYLISLGYSNMLSCDILIANININQSVASKLKINLSKKKSNIYFDICPDSLATLKQIVENMLSHLPESEKKEPINQPSNLSIAQEIKMTIDEDVYPSVKKKSIDLSSYDYDGYYKKSNSLIFDDSDACIIDYDIVENTPNLITSKNNTVFKSKDKIVSYNNDFKINYNYLEELLNEKKEKKHKSKFPEPIMKININNVNFHIRIFDGYDWTSTCQEVQSLDEFRDIVSMEYLRRSKKSVIDIDVNGIYFDYSIYPDESYYADKLYLLINEFEIIDKVPTSSWNQFLSAQTPIEHPMLKLKILNVRPIIMEPSQESIVNLEVSPLRFYIDQDTLLKFAEILSFCNLDTESENRTPTTTVPENNSKKDNSNQIYFRKVNISDIHIIVDYKPKQFNFNSLKDGQYGEILNILPLKDATLNFQALKFYGLSGINKLVQNIIEKYLPQTINQVPSIVLYIGPIRPFFKISEKMVDVIKNVYSNYQNEQPMIPAIEEGARQILTTTTTETLKLISRFSLKAQTLFENIETELSNDKRKNENYNQNNNYDNQPTLDYRYGIRYINSGTGSVKNAVKAVPVIICRPIIKLTKVVSKTTADVSNALDPRNKIENQKKYK
ncbi:hypothetical protein BCR32DRAFT_239867 [Anaeromyces robustus]|uniref:Autophagy-related protein 2 n=1 Tax=Anaeromyces robustus TaxID=1754192 RepID=A0A1Y1XPT4_9FUNG|nr:hypothetical protein BCR32DRAFT_239867 [Anaeromyces robustus]|eukprot:ORX87760.1 hypothetical protein BCR32DRAFT_239867 [Anaeromyces robustus]